MAKTTLCGVPAVPLAATRREYWQGVLDEWRRSGQRQTDFCRQRGLRVGTLAWWKHTLARPRRQGARPGVSGPAGPSTPARVTFVPLRITAARPARTTTVPYEPSHAIGGELEIVLEGGRRVRVQGRVDPQWLGQVIAVLASTRC